jgi:hypothetical protein
LPIFPGIETRVIALWYQFPFEYLFSSSICPEKEGMARERGYGTEVKGDQKSFTMVMFRNDSEL